MCVKFQRFITHWKAVVSHDILHVDITTNAH